MIVRIFLLWMWGLGIAAPLFGQFAVEGIVTDGATGAFVPFAQVRVLGTGSGTLTNEEGRFSLQIAGPDTLLVAAIGYDSRRVPVRRTDSDLTIALDTRTYSLAEVLIVPVTAEEILTQALAAIPQNYGHEPVLMQAFYRELIAQNGEYAALNEAVVDLYKTANGPEPQQQDQVRLVKGRRRGDAPKIPNLSLTLGPGGIHRLSGTAVTGQQMLESFLDPDHFKLYTYELTGVQAYQGRQVYEIRFDQERRLRKKLYAGTIYVDVETLAFVSIAYEISAEGRKFRASQLGGLKVQASLALARMLGYDFGVEDEQGRIDFRYHQARWYLAYHGYALDFALHIPEKATGDTLPQDIAIRARRELAVTRFEAGQPAAPFAPDVQFSRDSSLDAYAGPYEDSFWAGYSYLTPTQSLRRAAEAIRTREE